MHVSLIMYEWIMIYNFNVDTGNAGNINGSDWICGKQGKLIDRR